MNMSLSLYVVFLGVEIYYKVQIILKLENDKI